MTLGESHLFPSLFTSGIRMMLLNMAARKSPLEPDSLGTSVQLAAVDLKRLPGRKVVHDMHFWVQPSPSSCAPILTSPTCSLGTGGRHLERKDVREARPQAPV